MYKLFEERYRPREGVAQAFYKRETASQAHVIYNTLQTYFARSAKRLPNQHLLVQILRVLEFSLETPLLRVLDNLEARWLNVARHFQLNTPANYGKPRKDVFYASKANDVLDYILVTELCDIDPFDANKTWMHVSPFKVLYSPVTDYRWLLPCGDSYDGYRGFSVVALDIQLLALQYHQYRLDMYEKHKENTIMNPSVFLVNRALPMMYPSHIDMVVWNSFAVRHGFMDEHKPKEWLPVSFPDLAPYVRKMADSLIPKLSRSRSNYVHTLENLPALFAANALYSQRMPYMIHSRQSNWMVMLAKWRQIQFLLSLQGKQGQNVNSGLLAELKVQLKTFLNEKGYLHFENQQLEDEFVQWAERYI